MKLIQLFQGESKLSPLLKAKLSKKYFIKKVDVSVNEYADFSDIVTMVFDNFEVTFETDLKPTPPEIFVSHVYIKSPERMRPYITKCFRTLDKSVKWDLNAEITPENVAQLLAKAMDEYYIFSAVQLRDASVSLMKYYRNDTLITIDKPEVKRQISEILQSFSAVNNLWKNIKR